MNGPFRFRRGTIAVVSLVAVAAAATAVDARPAAALVDLPLNIGGFREGVYVPIDDQLLGQPGGASIVANGNLSRHLGRFRAAAGVQRRR